MVLKKRLRIKALGQGGKTHEKLENFYYIGLTQQRFISQEISVVDKGIRKVIHV